MRPNLAKFISQALNSHLSINQDLKEKKTFSLFLGLFSIIWIGETVWLERKSLSWKWKIASFFKGFFILPFRKKKLFTKIEGHFLPYFPQDELPNEAKSQSYDMQNCKCHKVLRLLSFFYLYTQQVPLKGLICFTKQLNQFCGFFLLSDLTFIKADLYSFDVALRILYFFLWERLKKWPFVLFDTTKN